MSHLHSPLAELLHNNGAAACTRRALLRGGLGLGATLAAGAALRPAQAQAQAALAVRVAAPHITRVDDCLANVAVEIAVAGGPATGRYLLYGDILEADTSTEEADFCCTLRAQHADLEPGGTRRLTLTQRAMAVDLGLVRGLGPAAHEAFSPNLVELFARVWLRDLTTEAVLGPWDSPQRIAVSRPLPGWMPSATMLGNPLLTPRGPGSVLPTTSDGQPLPPLPCAP